MMADQDTTTTTETTTTTTDTGPAPWHESIGDETVRGVASRFDSPDAFLSGVGIKVEPPDWRSSIKNKDAADFVKTLASPEDLALAGLDMRKKLSTAIRIPGKNAKPEEVAEYRAKLGIPEKPEEYAFKHPDSVPKEVVESEQVKARLGRFAQRFHEAGVPKAAAQAIIDAYWQEVGSDLEDAKKADEEFVASTEDALKTEWGTEYDANKTFSRRAVEFAFGDAAEDFRSLMLADGRFFGDHPLVAKAFARIGRLMGEERIGPALSSEARETLEEQADEARRKRYEAQGKGDTEAARRYDRQEREILAKIGSRRGPQRAA